MTVNSFESLIALKSDTTCVEQSRLLAEHLQIPLLVEGANQQFAYLLHYTERGLAIQQTGAGAPGPVLVDFTAGAADHRRKRGGGELIVKAVAGHKQDRPSVLDATAGLGRDSFVLASRGYAVTLCERSPLIAALLADGLSRARHSAGQHNDDELRAVIDRMQLVEMDSCEYLRREGQVNPPDVVVIDPMFPASKKSALVKKEMRAFQQLVGADIDSEELLTLAIATAKHRVVVKRPKKAEVLAGRKPNFTVEGKAIRFDIYSLRAFDKS